MRAPRSTREERETLDRLLQHGTAVRRERARAAAAGEAPDFARLCREWGGVSIVYRRSMEESPAYRLNHEEIIKALEEGISFIETLEPEEAVADEHGTAPGGPLPPRAATGEVVELPARLLPRRGRDHSEHHLREGASRDVPAGRAAALLPRRTAPRPTAGAAGGSSPRRPTTRARSSPATTGAASSSRFFGDNHPAFNGNVVKAMASAKKGYGAITDVLAAPSGTGRAGRTVAEWEPSARRVDDRLTARVVAVNRLTPTIVEVVVHAPAAARELPAGPVLPPPEPRGARPGRSGARRS